MQVGVARSVIVDPIGFAHNILRSNLISHIMSNMCKWCNTCVVNKVCKITNGFYETTLCHIRVVIVKYDISIVLGVMSVGEVD